MKPKPPNHWIFPGLADHRLVAGGVRKPTYNPAVSPKALVISSFSDTSASLILPANTGSTPSTTPLP